MDDGVEPMGHPVDHVCQPDPLDRFVDLIVGGIGSGEGDVVPYGAGEQERLLGNDTELTPQ